MLSKLTRYFRDAVVSQTTQEIDISEDSIKMDYTSIIEGKIDASVCTHLFTVHSRREEETSDLNIEAENVQSAQTVKVLIAFQVVNAKSENGVKHEARVENLTGTLFLPAILDETGRLTPDTERLPWIPRKYLLPVIDDALIVGDVNHIDLFIGSRTKELLDIRETGSWQLYIDFVKAFWNAVNQTYIGAEFIYNYSNDKLPLFLDAYAYIIPDKTIAATHHIKKLYEYALTQDQPFNRLYQTLLDKELKSDREPIENILPQMLGHCGQMNGSYPLSPSQREAVNHFSAISDGDILAVNGPPGTGKTTLLQTIVADMMVKHALKKEDAPIIVATSTNNQAVTNIIESFAAASNATHPRKIDCHWIDKKQSFATYFPSKNKRKAALEQGYQVTSAQMGDSVSEWETKENKEYAQTAVLDKCKELFQQKELNLKECIDRLYQLLADFDANRKRMLELAKGISLELWIPSGNTANGMVMVTDEINRCIKQEKQLKNRLDAWSRFWRRLILYRIFQFIPTIKKRLHTKMRNYMNLDECILDNHFEHLFDIEDYYSKLLEENQMRYNAYFAAKEIIEIAQTFEKYDIHVFASSKATVSLTMDALNALFDTNIRFYEFWLSVHYYECRWLNDEHKTDEKELFKSTYPVMRSKYKRLCMLTPCLVMTFYMLPVNFQLYKDRYLYDFIDLLIVDEAGQVSPEIGASAFLLAKKALVVGDIYQIEPVWSVPRELDIALAMDCGVIGENGFSELETSGLNTSESSLMKIACNACAFSKHGRKGLLLTEHRRCYDEMIGYCNELVYDGKLEPLRGRADQDKNYPFKGQPTLLHIHVSAPTSQKRKTSRYNPLEADAIIKWICDHYGSIREKYPKENENNLIGVITPFKAQADYIRNALGHFGEVSKHVTVGTVHTFQGGERRIILFSTVYGANEGCAFLDCKKNLMNVAMSRAKDRFIVFGDINCLSQSKETPSGLLKTYLVRNV